MCEIDGDVCTVWSRSFPRAAKDYRCAECGLPVSKGAKYVRVNMLFDGSWNTERAHPECERIAYDAAKAACGARMWEIGSTAEHLAYIGIGIGRGLVEVEVDKATKDALARRWRYIHEKYGKAA
jgi:hypothetical protein